MSLMIVSVSAKSVLIGVNTESVEKPGGKSSDGSKAAWVAHCNAVIAANGNAAIMAFTYLYILVRSVSFDETVVQMPEILQAAWTSSETAAQQAGWLEHLREQQLLTLAGWSRRQGRMRAFAYKHDGSGPFKAYEIADGFVSPGEPFDGVLPAVNSPASIERVARAQGQWGRMHHPDCPLRGRLQIIELTRGAVSMRDHCAL